MMNAYPCRCPLCGRGQLSKMILMDTWSCPTCRHMFGWHPRQQELYTLDLSSPLTWRWGGQGWRRGRRFPQPLTVGIMLFSLALVVMPSTLVLIASYLFPPLPGSPLAWFPLFWAAVAFVVHGVGTMWVWAESYQFSPYVIMKLKTRQWLERWA